MGYLALHGEHQPVYDFYDADLSPLLRGKEAAGAVFERAVGLYAGGDYAAAYRLFIDVIKASPLDLAAREYLKKSYARLGSNLPPDILLD